MRGRTKTSACTLLALLCSCSSTRLFHSEPHRLLPPTHYSQRKSTLFGYSAAYQELSSGEELLIVGAPTASEDGNIFACMLSTLLISTANNTTCRSIPIDVGAYRVHMLKGKTYYFQDHDTWLGATIATIGMNKFITCAPRWINNTGEGQNSYDVLGTCYEIDMTRATPGRMIMTPKYESDCNFCDYSSLSNGGYGWSLAVQDETLYVGGPAVCTSGVYYSTNVRKYFDMHNRRKIVYAYDIFKPNCKVHPSVHSTINFGYVIAFGYFLARYYGEVKAISSSYGRHGYGMVSITHDDQNIKNIHGSKVGSLFGAALCSVHLSGKAHTDLLVGAPSHTENENYPDKGAVFLYIGGNPLLHAKDVKPTATLHGAKGKLRSYFGSTIANLKDLDGDGRDDFAIGAPYEDDMGAVYVFMSSDFDNLSRNFRYTQRIIPGNKGFGSSIVKLPDIDQNGCNEMAVGAIEDATVLVLRCLPIVTVTIEPDPYLKKMWTLPINATSFQFESCVKVMFSNKKLLISGQLTVETTFSESAAVINPNDREYKIYFNQLNVKPICRNITVITKLPFVVNRMAITMKVKMLNDCFKKAYDPKCAVLSQKSILRYNEYLTTARGCREECNPVLNFNMSAKIIAKSHALEIGSLDAVTVQVYVQNSADTAYDWCMILLVDGADLAGPLTGSCKRDQVSRQYICKPKALFPGDFQILNLIVHTRRLTSADKYVLVTANVKAKCNNAVGLTKNITIDLFADPNAVIIKSGVGQNIFTIDKREIYDLSEKTTKFEHTYWIENKGPTNWVNTSVEVASPKLEYLHIGLPEEESMICSYLGTSDSVPHSIIRCSIREIKRFNIFNFNLPLVLMHGSVGTELDKEVNITTFAELSNTLFTVSVGKKMAQFQTVLRAKATAEVKWWYILLACILALLIISLAALILYRTGFFRRSVQKKLHELKRKSVLMRAQRESSVALAT